MDKHIHTEQSGFMRGHLASDNLRQHLTGSNDSIYGLYYEGFQFSDELIKLVRIHANPSVMVSTKGQNSNPFPIFRGTMQDGVFYPESVHSL